MSEPAFSPTVVLLTVSRVQGAAYAEALKPFGLTTREDGLLGHIRATPGVSFSGLAHRSRITVQSAHAAVAAFTADALVEDDTARAGAASAQRVTPVGEELLAKVAAKVAELDAQFATAHPESTQALRTGVAGFAARNR